MQVVVRRPRQLRRGDHERAGGRILRIDLHVDDADVGRPDQFGADSARQRLRRIALHPLPAELDLVAFLHPRPLEHRDFELRRARLRRGRHQVEPHPRRGERALAVDRALLGRAGDVHDHARPFGLAHDRRSIRQLADTFDDQLEQVERGARLGRENQDAAAVAILRRLLDDQPGNHVAAFCTQALRRVRDTQLNLVFESLALHGHGNRHGAVGGDIHER